MTVEHAREYLSRGLVAMPGCATPLRAVYTDYVRDTMERSRDRCVFLSRRGFEAVARESGMLNGALHFPGRILATDPDQGL